MLHPTFWLKAVAWFATPFVSKKFWNKYFELESLSSLFRFLPADRVTVPPFVLEFDLRVNGPLPLQQTASDAATAAVAGEGDTRGVSGLVSDSAL